MYSFDPKINVAARTYLEAAQAYQASKLCGIFERVTRDEIDPSILHTDNPYDLILAREEGVKAVHYHGVYDTAFDAIEELGVASSFRKMDSALTLARPPKLSENWLTNPEERLIAATLEHERRISAVAHGINERLCQRKIFNNVAGDLNYGAFSPHSDVGAYTVSSAALGTGTGYVRDPDMTAEKYFALKRGKIPLQDVNVSFAKAGDILAFKGMSYLDEKGLGKLYEPEDCLLHFTPKKALEHRHWVGLSGYSY